MKVKFAIAGNDIVWTDSIDELAKQIDVRPRSRILVAHDGEIIDYDLCINADKWGWHFEYAGQLTNQGVRTAWDSSIVIGKLSKEIEEILKFCLNKRYFKTLFPEKSRREIEKLAREH